MRAFNSLCGVGALLVALASCAGNLASPDAEVDASGPPPGCDGQGHSRCVASVSLGTRFGCAALRDQTAWCWGRNDESQLGYESTDLCPERLSGGQTRAVACHMYPLRVPGLAGVTAVSAGGAHACALLASGELRCWGGNTRGQLGNGSALPSRTPAAVPGLAGVTSLATGASHTCAVVAGGQVYCWGANDRGQLGVRSTPNDCGAAGSPVPCARAPVAVPDLTDAVAVVAGDAHTCVLAAAGRVWCWGTNVDGQLGAGAAGPMPSPAPQAVKVGASILRNVRALAAGGEHTCALRADGAVLCWGRHDRGQLGVAVPERFEPCAHACVTTAVPIVGYEGDGSVEGPDGDPDGGGLAPVDASLPLDAALPRDVVVPRDVPDAAADRPAPQDVPLDLPAVIIDASGDSGVAAPTVASISAGSAFSCLSLSDRTVRCWGTNRTYELGSGQVNEGGAAITTVIASPGSAATNPLQGVEAIESGGATTCALLTDRGLKCWGTNEGGALGVGDVSERNGPVSMTW